MPLKGQRQTFLWIETSALSLLMEQRTGAEQPQLQGTQGIARGLSRNPGVNAVWGTQVKRKLGVVVCPLQPQRRKEADPGLSPQPAPQAPYPVRTVAKVKVGLKRWLSS